MKSEFIVIAKFIVLDYRSSLDPWFFTRSGFSTQNLVSLWCVLVILFSLHYCLFLHIIGLIYWVDQFRDIAYPKLSPTNSINPSHDFCSTYLFLRDWVKNLQSSLLENPSALLQIQRNHACNYIKSTLQLLLCCNSQKQNAIHVVNQTWVCRLEFGRGERMKNPIFPTFLPHPNRTHISINRTPSFYSKLVSFSCNLPS